MILDLLNKITDDKHREILKFAKKEENDLVLHVDIGKEDKENVSCLKSSIKHIVNQEWDRQGISSNGVH